MVKSMSYTPYSPAAAATRATCTGPTPGVLELRARWQAHVLPTLHGAVLDVGAGEGAGLGHLPHASSTWLLEPHPGAVRRLERVAAHRPEVHVLPAVAERIPLPDEVVDAALCSAVLCSVSDPDQVLAEICRVLRPGGRLVLLEHVAADRGTLLRLGQRLLSPASRRLDRGCDLGRDTEAALTRSALQIEELHRIVAVGPFGIPLPHLAAVLTRLPSPRR